MTKYLFRKNDGDYVDYEDVLCRIKREGWLGLTQRGISITSSDEMPDVLAYENETGVLFVDGRDNGERPCRQRAAFRVSKEEDLNEPSSSDRFARSIVCLLKDQGLDVQVVEMRFSQN